MRILLVAKEHNRVETLLAGFAWDRVSTCADAFSAIENQLYDLVVVDHHCNLNDVLALNAVPLTGLDDALLKSSLDQAVKQRVFAQAIQDTARLLNRPFELEQVLDQMLAAIGTVMPFDIATIMLIEAGVAHVVRTQGKHTGAAQVTITDRPDLRQIMAEGKPIVLPDTHTNPTWADVALRSHIGVPILLRSEIIGFLNLDSHQPFQFSAADAEWLQIFAEHISLALYNSRLYHDELKHQQEVEALRKLASLLTSTLKLDHLTQSILAHLKSVIPYDTVALLLNDGNQLEIVAVGGFARPEQFIGTRIVPNEHDLLRELITTGRPVGSPDAQSDPRFADWSILDYQRSWLAVPLNAHHACIGYLILNSRYADLYGWEERNLVKSFADQTALAIYNAQLYEEIRRYSDELEDRVSLRTAELREANAHVKRSEQRYRALFEATFEGICVHEQGIILDANPAFLDMFGYSLSQTIGMNVLALAATESHDLIMEKVRSQDETLYEIVGMRKNGERFPLELIGKQHVYEGRPVRIVALRDITERKHMEQHRLELVLEKERMQILRNFITQSSHEFRTPLSVIQMNADLLKRELDSEKLLKRVHTIKLHVVQITELVQNMVTLSKLDSEGQLLSFEDVNINDLIRFATQTQATAVQAKNLRLTLALTETPLLVRGDADYLHMALIHLIANAVRYTPAEGAITVQSERHDDHVLIRIADTGVGIDEAVLPHVFERFFRDDVVGTTRGFGLGLSIANAVVAKHAGRIDAESVVGQGSTFSVWLPLARD